MFVTFVVFSSSYLLFVENVLVKFRPENGVSRPLSLGGGVRVVVVLAVSNGSW